MPSSTDPAEVRPARFDRPLSGPHAARFGAAWGDPVLDAQIAEAVADGRRNGLAHGFASGWAAGRQAAAQREAAEAAARVEAAHAEQLEQRRHVEKLVTALRGAVRSAGSVAAPGYEELADVLTDGALAIARAAVARELSSV